MATSAIPYQIIGVICIAFAPRPPVRGWFLPDVYAFLATAYEDEHRAAGKN
jgi:hypothetical protein